MGTQSQCLFPQLTADLQFAENSESLHENVPTQDESGAINVLPDDVLLDIFDLCQENPNSNPRPLPVWKWHFLVHVCKRWRKLAFSSPYRLNLHILCTCGTPVRKNLGIWPAFPIVLDFFVMKLLAPNDEDNAIAALEYSDRVDSVMLYLTGSQLANMAMVMSKPFPLLTRLKIHAITGNVPALPDGFLGGSAPRLQQVYLDSIPFPALPTLLLSANNLNSLFLSMIPPSGYIQPEAMVVCLSALPRLKTLAIEFQSGDPHPDRICPPHPTRNVLPSPTTFYFRGASEYLEDLVAQIDGPQLDHIYVLYLNHPHHFQPARLSEFINRSVGPELNPSRSAHVIFTFTRLVFTLGRANYPCQDQRKVEITIAIKTRNWHTPDLARVLSEFSATFYNVVHLELELQLEENILQIVTWESFDWLHLFRRFPAMKNIWVPRTVHYSGAEIHHDGDGR